MFQPGPTSYSTLATLPDGNVGLLYEPGNGIRFAKFNLPWLQGLCAPLTAPELTIERGNAEATDLTIENQLGPTIKVDGLDFDAPAGWTITTGPTPSKILPGSAVTVPVDVDVPATASGGTYRIPVSLTDTADRSSRGTLVVVVPKTEDEIDGRINVTGGTLTNPKATPYAVGDRLQFRYRVTNLTDAVTTVVPNGNLRDLDPSVDARNCRWRNLPAFDAYNCTFPYHVITQDDLDRGSFTPLTTWTSTSGDDVTAVEHSGEAVPLP